MSDDQDTTENESEGIKNLRANRDTLASENAELKKKLTFLEAGVDISSDLGQLFAKGYDGDLDAAQVKEAWGRIAPSAPQPAPAPSTETRERESFAREGITAPLDPAMAESDPIKAGREAFDARLRAGSTRDDASAEIVTRLIDAGARGDSRVVYDRDRWREEQGFR